MRFFSWLRHLSLDHVFAPARRAPRRKRAAPRLRLEPLEDRWCPSGSYSVTDLGTLGGADSYATAINAVGQVVGEASTGTEGHAFLWQSGTGMTDLSTLGGTSSYAHAINAYGQVVGDSTTASGADHAFLWTPTAKNGTTKLSLIDLGTLGGATSIAYGINSSGQVVGQSDSASGQHHAFLWQSSTGMIDLGTFGGTFSTAAGINDAGQVFGSANLSGDTFHHAFLWQNSVMTDLGTLGGNNSAAWAINTGGQVAGQADTTSGKSTQFHAFRWTPSSPNGTTGKMKDLGALNTNTTVKDSAGYGINDSGYVVGTDGDGGAFPLYAVYWPGSGSLQNLNDLVPANSGIGLLQDATGINNSGRIAGYGQLPSQPITHAFLLTPTTPGQALVAAAIPAHAVHQTLTVSQATPLLTEAIARWQAAGVNTTGLGHIQIQTTNLGGSTLGLADETHHTIQLDNNAAGWGWFVDPTPHDDSEFTTPGRRARLRQRPEQHRMDLLTVLEHEVGHLLGHEHEETGVMIDTLPTGTRRTPGSARSLSDGSVAVDLVFAEDLHSGKKHDRHVW